jgi:putative oxidoreductase
MKIASLVSRYLLGFMYLVLGLNGFLGFIPLPAFQGNPADFMKILFVTKFLHVVKAIEIVCGLMLLSNQFARLSAVILMPITVNILLFHLLIEQGNPIMSLVMLVMNVLILLGYYEDLKVVLKQN